MAGDFNPSEKYSSVGIIIPNIWKNKIHDPNHQPVYLAHSSIQWPFQDPRLEVPTIYKAYVRPM